MKEGIKNMPVSSVTRDFGMNSKIMFNNSNNFTNINIVDRYRSNRYNMFYSCDNITTSVNNINALVNLTNGAWMFYVCANMTGSIDLSGLGNLTNGCGMFSDCKITSVSNINALVNLTNGYGMFSDSSNLTGSINLSGLSKLRNGYLMFFDCYNITTSVNNINALVNLTGGAQMFTNCYRLTGSINLSGLSKLTTGNYMFSNCYNITSIIETSFDNLTLTTLSNNGLRYTFYYCNNMTGNALRLLSTSRNVYLDPGTRSNTFSNCAKLTDYSLIHTNWK
jgi:hypothetical protein